MKTTGEFLRNGFRLAAFNSGRRLQMTLGVKRKWKKSKDCDENYSGQPETTCMHEVHDVMPIREPSITSCHLESAKIVGIGRWRRTYAQNCVARAGRRYSIE